MGSRGFAAACHANRTRNTLPRLDLLATNSPENPSNAAGGGVLRPHIALSTFFRCQTPVNVAAMDLHERVVARLKAVLPARAKLLIAVSGGVDSMVLLEIMARVRKREGWQIAVAHLNHQLRGKSSDADERLVRRAARKLRLKAAVGEADVRKLSRENKVSLEMAARQARREFLLATALKARASHLLLAHHADDQIELFFLRLIRGSGPDGLGGMRLAVALPPGNAGSFRNRNVKEEKFIVRPLLHETKKTILDYARANRIEFREDATNRSLDISRNRIRHELLPLIEAGYHPFSRLNVLRMMELLRDEAEFTASFAAQWLDDTRAGLQKSTVPFADLHPALQRRVIQLQLFRLRIEPDFGLVEQLRLAPGKRISFANSALGTFVQRDVTGVITPARSESRDFDLSQRHVAVGPRIAASFSGVSFYLVAAEARRWTGGNFKVQAPNVELFDATKVGARITLRHWRPGDRFQPIGMPKPAKLQDLFVNAKILASKRRSLIVAQAASGEIFWVEGLRISERFKVTSGTRKILRWAWKRNIARATPPLR